MFHLIKIIILTGKQYKFPFPFMHLHEILWSHSRRYLLKGEHSTIYTLRYGFNHLEVLKFCNSTLAILNHSTY